MGHSIRSGREESISSNFSRSCRTARTLLCEICLGYPCDARRDGARGSTSCHLIVSTRLVPRYNFFTFQDAMRTYVRFQHHQSNAKTKTSVTTVCDPICEMAVALNPDLASANGRGYACRVSSSGWMGLGCIGSGGEEIAFARCPLDVIIIKELDTSSTDNG